MGTLQRLVETFVVSWVDKWLVKHTFYNGLLYYTRMALDAAVGGALMNSPQDVGYNLIEDMTKNHHSWRNAREISVKSPQKGGLYEVSQFDHMNAKVDALYQKLESFPIASSASTSVDVVNPTPHAGPLCEVCRVNGHSIGDCHMILVGGTNRDIVNYVNNQRETPYSNTYKPGWRDHPNFSYKK